jgi:hypothetical protein
LLRRCVVASLAVGVARQKMVEGLGLRFEFIGMIRRRKGRLGVRFPPGATLL